MSIEERRQALAKMRKGEKPAEVAALSGTYTGARRVVAGKKGWASRDALARAASMANLAKGRLPRRRFTIKKAAVSTGVALATFAPSSFAFTLLRGRLGQTMSPFVSTLFTFGTAGSVSYASYKALDRVDTTYRVAAAVGVLAGSVLGPSMYEAMAWKDGAMGRLGKKVLELSKLPGGPAALPQPEKTPADPAAS